MAKFAVKCISKSPPNEVSRRTPLNVNGESSSTSKCFYVPRSLHSAAAYRAEQLALLPSLQSSQEQQRFELQVVSLGHNDDAIAVGVIGCARVHTAGSPVDLVDQG